MIPKHNYKYLISYNFGSGIRGGFGSMIINRKHRILKGKDKTNIEKLIKDKNDFEIVVLLNFILMS